MVHKTLPKSSWASLFKWGSNELFDGLDAATVVPLSPLLVGTHLVEYTLIVVIRPVSFTLPISLDRGLVE